MRRTGFYWNEACFWHAGGQYAALLPVGLQPERQHFVQPLMAGGLPENPETKRRFRNLVEVTGLMRELATPDAAPVTEEDLRRVHPADFLARFKQLSDAGGGELGLRAPFGAGGYEIAALSAGLIKTALFNVLKGTLSNAYALCRPPGHHCEAATPMGFCLLANIAIAIEAARASGLAERFAVLDWDVHHGNGTQSLFLERGDVLTISIHQERNFPPGPGSDPEVTGTGAGAGCNMNIPLLPGAGHAAYLYAMERLVEPALVRFRPDVILVASGFDAAGVDVLSRTLAHAGTFKAMTERLMAVADTLCDGRIAMAHEGGYSEAYVPFCGHAVLQQLSGSTCDAGDPLYDRITSQQANARFQALQRTLIDETAAFFGMA